MCLNIYSTTKFDGHDYFYDFWTDVVDGRYAEGGWQTGNVHVGQWGFVTQDQCKERAIQATLDYLGINWKNVYGVDMKRSDICGQESVWICEEPKNGYEKDQYGNRRLNIACNPPCIPNWQCEQPLNGYENDGCGNRRENLSKCNPCSDANVILTIFG